MYKLEEIRKKMKQNKEELKARYKLKRIGIFGSYIKDQQHSNSDIDILVEFEPDFKFGLLKFIEIENYFSKLLDIKVDLVMKSALKPAIGENILKEVVYL